MGIATDNNSEVPAMSFGPTTRLSTEQAYEQTLRAAGSARQKDELPETRHDRGRCVPQCFVVSAAVASSAAIDRMIDAVDPQSAREKGMLAAIRADRRDDGALTTESIERLGDLLYATFSARSEIPAWKRLLGGGTPLEAARAAIRASGGEITLDSGQREGRARLFSLSTLGDLEKGEFALVLKPSHYGVIPHVVLVGRAPDGRWLAYNPDGPASRNHMRFFDSREDAVDSLRPDLGARLRGRVGPLGVLGRFRLT